MSQARRGRPGWIPAAVCAGAAVLLRAAYLIESAENPFRVHLGLDMAGYDRWARAILEGRGLGEAPFPQAPFFPLALAALYGLLGPDPVRVLWAHLLPSAAAVFLAADAARRWRGAVAAWAAGILLALYKPAIFYTGTLLPPVWTLFLAALALWISLRLFLPSSGAEAAGGRSGRQGAPSSPRGLAAAGGLAFGLLATAQPAAALGAAPAAWRLRRQRTALALWLAGGALPVLFTLLYNGAAGEAWSAIAVNGGVNLYIGNGPEANGAYVRPPAMREDRDLLGIEAARRLSGGGSGFGASEADRFWRERAWAHVAAHPARTAGLFLRKAALYFGAYEVPQVESLPFERRYSSLLRGPLPGMAVLTALAVFGLLLLRRDPEARWLAASAAVMAAGVCLFFVTARFRVATAPFLAVLAAGGVGAALPGRGGSAGSRGASGPAAAAAGRRPRELLIPGVAGAAVLLLLWSNLPGLDRRASDGQYHYRLGVILEKENRTGEASEEYRRALELDPTLGKAEVNLGTLLARAGRLDEARPHLERGVGLDPLSAIGWTNLGQLHQLQGRPAEARAAFRRALEADPNHAAAARSLQLLEEEGRGREP